MKLELFKEKLQQNGLNQEEINKILELDSESRLFYAQCAEEILRENIESFQLRSIPITHFAYVHIANTYKRKEEESIKQIENCLKLPNELCNTEHNPRIMITTAMGEKRLPSSLYESIFAPTKSYAYKIWDISLAVCHGETQLNWQLMNLYLKHRKKEDGTDLDQLMRQSLTFLHPVDIARNGHIDKEAYTEFLRAHPWSLETYQTMINRGHWESLADALHHE